MSKVNKSINFARRRAGELIKCVLAKRMPVKQALLAFPRDIQDQSVIASWHALCHLEADEDLRKKDKEYAEEQDLYLADIAEILYSGQELPFNIRDAYKQYYNSPLNPHKPGFAGFLAGLRNFLVIKK